MQRTNLRTVHPLLAVFFFACSDYNINKITDDEDTGVVSEPPNDHTCREMQPSGDRWRAPLSSRPWVD